MGTIQSASSRIHVLEVIGNAIVGGMENCAARLIERLPAERFGVSVLCPFESPFTDQLRGLGAEVYITPMSDDPSWGSIQLACALVRANSVDIIHSHLQNAHLLAGLTGRLTGKPVLATIHGRQLTSLDLEVHRIAATHLNVVCKQSYFHSLGIGVAPSQLHLIANGVDTETFLPTRNAAGALRRRYAIPESAKVVGFVGRLAPEKGPDVFLRVALGVREKIPDAHFVVIGEGSMRKQLETFVRQFDLASTVHLAGMQTDMPGVMAELDVLVSTSHSEAMPLALMEAMASGLPVVATRVGGIPDLVQHGVTGWLADDGDYEGLGSRVVDLLRDEKLLADAGAAARRRAVERLSLAENVNQMIQLLAQLVHERPDHRRITTVAADGQLVARGVAASGKSMAR